KWEGGWGGRGGGRRRGVGGGGEGGAWLDDPAITAGIGQFAVIQSVAPSLGVEVVPISVQDAAEIERAVTAFARSGDRGLIVTASASALVHRKLIVALRPGTSCLRCTGSVTSVTTGGLISYGAEYIEQYRRASVYVD